MNEQKTVLSAQDWSVGDYTNLKELLLARGCPKPVVVGGERWFNAFHKVLAGFVAQQNNPKYRRLMAFNAACLGSKCKQVFVDLKQEHPDEFPEVQQGQQRMAKPASAKVDKKKKKTPVIDLNDQAHKNAHAVLGGIIGGDAQRRGAIAGAGARASGAGADAFS